MAVTIKYLLGTEFRLTPNADVLISHETI